MDRWRGKTIIAVGAGNTIHSEIAKAISDKKLDKEVVIVGTPIFEPPPFLIKATPIAIPEMVDSEFKTGKQSRRERRAKQRKKK